MTKKIIQERISRTGEQPLSLVDIDVLKKRRNKQLLMLASGYFPFIAFGVYMIIYGADSLNTGRHFTHVDINDEQKGRYWGLLPYFLGFLFIILNIYFIKLYLESILPLTKDIKSNKKQLLFFKPEKNPMAIFNKYFISTPLFKQQQIQISREDFDSIGENDEIWLEIGHQSLYILRFMSKEKEIKVLNNY